MLSSPSAEHGTELQPSISPPVFSEKLIPSADSLVSPLEPFNESCIDQVAKKKPAIDPFNYDSIDVCEAVLCAFTVTSDENLSFEEVMHNSMYGDGPHVPHQEKGYPSCVQQEYYMSDVEDNMDLKSISEHGGEPVLFENKEFRDLPHYLPPTSFSTMCVNIANIDYAADFSTLKECLTYELFTYTMVLLILSLFTVIGYLCDLSALPLTLLT